MKKEEFMFNGELFDNLAEGVSSVTPKTSTEKNDWDKMLASVNLKDFNDDDTIKRPDWDSYFMRIAHDVSLRSTCMRRAVGAVAVSTDHRILGTGYNGALPGAEHCDTAGCIRNELNIPSGERQEICRAQHAEANVCNIAAKYGTSLKGATMYITTRPCTTCLKAMVTSGIEQVVFDDDYPDDFAMQIAKEAGIEVKRFKMKED